MLRPTLLALLLPGLACGPTSSDDTGDPPATSAVTSTGEDPGTSTSATTEPSDPSSSEPPTTGPISTTDATTGPLATTTDATGVTDDTGDTGTAEDVAFSAHFHSGGLDDLSIYKADFTQDLCISLHFVAPEPVAPEFPIVAPPTWALLYSARALGTVNCLEGLSKAPGSSAVAGIGEIAWENLPMKICPGQVDVDVTVTFPEGDEVVQAIGVPVEGCT